MELECGWSLLERQVGLLLSEAVRVQRSAQTLRDQRRGSTSLEVQDDLVRATFFVSETLADIGERVRQFDEMLCAWNRLKDLNKTGTVERAAKSL
jgi:hypothetical protein